MVILEQQENIGLAISGATLVVRKENASKASGSTDTTLDGVEIFVTSTDKEVADGADETRHPTDAEWAESRQKVIAALDKFYQKAE